MHLKTACAGAQRGTRGRRIENGTGAVQDHLLQFDPLTNRKCFSQSRNCEGSVCDGGRFPKQGWRLTHLIAPRSNLRSASCESRLGRLPCDYSCAVRQIGVESGHRRTHKRRAATLNSNRAEDTEEPEIVSEGVMKFSRATMGLPLIAAGVIENVPSLCYSQGCTPGAKSAA